MLSFLKKGSIFIFLSACLLILSQCKQADNTSSQNEKPTPPQPQEDDLLLRLSAEMSTDTGRLATERNAIIDFAIEEMKNIHPTSSGLFYEIIYAGDGENIQWGDYLKTHYKGTFLDGKEFANSIKQNQPLEFYVGNMIDAWNEGLPLIKVGGKIHLYAPSHLAYGEEGLKKRNENYLVAPNQVLRFEIEVLEKLSPPQ